jgi:hypothetical protein
MQRDGMAEAARPAAWQSGNNRIWLNTNMRIFHGNRPRGLVAIKGVIRDTADADNRLSRLEAAAAGDIIQSKKCDIGGRNGRAFFR